MKALILAITALVAMHPSRSYDQYSDNGMYSVWAEPGFRLMMSDNGTPFDYDDDWVVDWEYNRDVVVMVLDK